MLVGYARVSTDAQDAASQVSGLVAAGVDEKRIYVDHGYTGRRTDRPALREAMAALRDGDELVVTKLDRLARSVPDLRSILDGLYARGVRVRIDKTVYDPSDPMGRLLVNVLALVAEFEADLISARTKAGMDVARRKGRLKGRAPKLSTKQVEHLVHLHDAQTHSPAELAGLFKVSVATVYRTLRRHSPTPNERESADVVA